jgi:hypothetical protein
MIDIYDLQNRTLAPNHVQVPISNSKTLLQIIHDFGNLKQNIQLDLVLVLTGMVWVQTNCLGLGGTWKNIRFLDSAACIYYLYK